MQTVKQAKVDYTELLVMTVALLYNRNAVSAWSGFDFHRIVWKQLHGLARDIHTCCTTKLSHADQVWLAGPSVVWHGLGQCSVRTYGVSKEHMCIRHKYSPTTISSS